MRMVRLVCRFDSCLCCMQKCWNFGGQLAKYCTHAAFAFLRLDLELKWAERVLIEFGSRVSVLLLKMVPLSKFRDSFNLFTVSVAVDHYAALTYGSASQSGGSWTGAGL